MTAYFQKLTSDPVFLLCLILGIGYLIGRIKLGSLTFGASGILLVGLVFGHFGYEVSPVIQNVGLICFVTSVGFIAGPGFFGNFKGKAIAYVVIGAGIIAAGVLTCIIVILVSGVSGDLCMGLLAGSLTTTPGLAAAIESTGSDMVSVGYGIAYPFGVLSVVVFVQVLPKLLHADLEKEKRELSEKHDIQGKTVREKLIKIDGYGLFSFSIAVILGLIIGYIRIPLPGGGEFSLGTSGGPLLAGIIIGYFRTIGRLDLRVKKEALVTIRELGLAFFLAGAGTHAGVGFVKTLSEYGFMLFVYGALMAIVPLVTGYLIAHKAFKLNTLDSMGSICGGMTSTPALGALISSAGTDDVTNSYAATYPIALALIVMLMELMGGFLY
jgi:putative transport protein